jgi:hypothetical protein
MKNDLDMMSALLDEDLVYVRNSAVVDTKASYLDSMRRGETIYDIIEHTNDSVRLFGCVAILSGQGRYDVRIAGKPLKLMLRYHSIWQKKTKQAELCFVAGNSRPAVIMQSPDQVSVAVGASMVQGVWGSGKKSTGFMSLFCWDSSAPSCRLFST